MARDEEKRKKVAHHDEEESDSDKKTLGDSDLGEVFETEEEDEEANDFSADFDSEENE